MTNSEMVQALKGTRDQVQDLKDQLYQKISDGFTLSQTEIAVLLTAENILNGN